MTKRLQSAEEGLLHFRTDLIHRPDESCLREPPTTVEDAGDRYPALKSPPYVASSPVEGGGMPITVVTHSLLAGGAERHSVDLAVGLKKQGFDPVVITTHGKDTVPHAEFVEALKEHKIPTGERNSPAELQKTIERGKATIWWGTALSAYSRLGKSIPGNIYINHSSWDRSIAMVRSVSDCIEHGVGVCGPAAAIINEATGRDDARTIWNGTSYRPDGPMRHRVDDEFVLGFLGRYGPEKNLKVAIDALKCLPPKFKMRFWGWGEEKPGLAQYAAELGVDDRLDLCGKPRNRDEAFASMDAIFLCSVAEGFPMVLAEAALAGVPVITPPHGDLELIFGDRGIIIEPTAFELAMAAMRLEADANICSHFSNLAGEYAAKMLLDDHMCWTYGEMVLEVAE